MGLTVLIKSRNQKKYNKGTMINTKQDLAEYIKADKEANNYTNKSIIIEKLKGNNDNALIMQLLVALRRFENAVNNNQGGIRKIEIPLL